MTNNGKIHLSAGAARNAPRPPLRGLMLDAARLVESPDYYRRFIAFCAGRGINTVIFRLTDDQGCAMRFRSHPELLTHPNALQPGDASGLARYAADHGVDLIPEIESFGHSLCITRAAEHADLRDQGPDGPDWANALIPLHPKTMKILSDLYAEAAELFPSRYLHAGCDETNWGGSDFSRELLKTRIRQQVWGEYLNALRANIQALGRETIVWDDMVLQHDPSILDHLDRRIILHDWDYWSLNPAPIAARLKLAAEKGFRMIGGPALIWCKWGSRPGLEQLRNIDAYADVYRAADTPPALGVIVTNWVPTRYLQRSIWDGLAYAAAAMAGGGAAARETAFKIFVEQHYGADWNEDWAGVFTAIYDAAPSRQGERKQAGFSPWSDEIELEQAIAAAPEPDMPFDSMLETLDSLDAGVSRNRDDFAAFRLSVAYLAHVHWRRAAVQGRSGEKLHGILAEIARRDRRLADALMADWQCGRKGDPSASGDQGAVLDLAPEDLLHSRFFKAAKFSAECAKCAQ